MISCRHCHAENPQGTRFCQACGTGLGGICASCGATIDPSARFCGQCGAALDAGQLLLPSPAASVATSESRLPQEGERKLVTVLFADIRGSTQLIESLDPEAAMSQLDPTLQIMTQAVTRFGGVVNSIRGDGIMALFGAPTACEDHAVQACLAACDMIDAAERLDDPNIAIRVGIDSGEVVIRSTGRDASDYDATGVIAHLANRMEQQATPGTAFLTGRTARLARGQATVVSLGRMAIKGLSEPLEVFQLLAAMARPSWQVRSSAHPLNSFIGRQAELAQMAAALERAGLGRGQVLVVVADAGFGKSRLAHEFLRALPDGGWNVLCVAAMSHTAGAPYHLAAELLRAVLAVGAADDCAEVERKLAQTLTLLDPEHETDLAPLQSLLDLPVQDEQWPRLAPTVRRLRLISALKGIVLREATLRPLVLLVEDYHWADLPSSDLLDVMVEGGGKARLLLLVTMRPDRYPPWVQSNYCVQLQLPALDPEGAATLLREVIGPSADLEPLRRQILGQAGGVPLFIEEIARSLSESGVVANQASPQRATALLANVVIPASVQAIVAARIDRLPPGRRRLLHVASVIGKDIPLNLLERVADLPHDRLEGELAQLQTSGFLYEVGIALGKGYTFRHVLIQTVAYKEMLRKTRRELHARVMTAMETVFAGRLDELTERLAEHALRGEVWPAAVSYALKAGDRAIGHWAWREAIGFYDRAIEALTHLPENAETIRTAIQARLRLRVALPGVADLPRVALCLDEARRLAAPLGDPAQLADIDTSRCFTLTKMGRLDQAIEVGHQGYAMACEFGDKGSVLNASFALAQACWYRGEFRQSEALVTQCLAGVRGELRLKRTGTTGTASVLALVCLSKTYAITGQFEKAFATIAEARQVAHDTGKPFDVSYCGVGAGFCRLVHGDPRGAATDLEEALHIARVADIALLIPSSQRYLGCAYALAGRIQEARDVLDDAIARTTAAGLLGMRLWSRAALAQAQLAESDSQARATLVDTLELAQCYGFRPLQVQLMRLIGSMNATEDARPAESPEPMYRHAIELAHQLGMAPEEAHAQRDLAAWLLRAGRKGLITSPPFV